MNPKASRAGLCLTCNHALECVLRADPDTPVWHCEEYDDSEPGETTAFDLADRAVSPEIPQPDDSANDEILLGLCVNCQNRSTCCLPRAEGGVWFCEEYA